MSAGLEEICRFFANSKFLSQSNFPTSYLHLLYPLGKGKQWKYYRFIHSWDFHTNYLPFIPTVLPGKLQKIPSRMFSRLRLLCLVVIVFRVMMTLEKSRKKTLRLNIWPYFRLLRPPAHEYSYPVPDNRDADDRRKKYFKEKNTLGPLRCSLLG